MEKSGFVWVLAATAGYGVAHSLLAAHFIKRWAEKVERNAARRFYRLFYALLAGLGLLPLLALALGLPDQKLYAIPLPWAVLTLGLQAAAGWGLLKAVSQTDAWAFIGLRQLSEPQALVPEPGPRSLMTGGWYRYVRHPLYFLSLVILWLMPWMSWNLLALALGLSLYMLVGIWFEERKLVAEFGPAYLEYRQRTKMLIPWVL
jgi:methanethiol S-methyltransferase